MTVSMVGAVAVAICVVCMCITACVCVLLSLPRAAPRLQEGADPSLGSQKPKGVPPWALSTNDNALDERWVTVVPGLRRH